jgi:hypothetical protein
MAKNREEQEDQPHTSKQELLQRELILVDFWLTNNLLGFYFYG